MQTTEEFAGLARDGHRYLNCIALPEVTLRPERLLLVLASLVGCSRPIASERNDSLSIGECVENYPRAFPRASSFRSFTLRGHKIAIEWHLRALSPEPTPGYVLQSSRSGNCVTIMDFVGAPSPVVLLEVSLLDEKQGKVNLDLGRAFGPEIQSASDERSPFYREHFSVTHGQKTVAGIAIMHQSHTVSHWILARGAAGKVHILRFRSMAPYPLSRTGCEYSALEPFEELAEVELPVDATFEEKVIRATK